MKDTIQMTAANAKTIVDGLVNGLLACHDKDEWISLTLNLTAGPKEGPVLHLSFLPGTTGENAKRIQQLFLEKGAEANK